MPSPERPAPAAMTAPAPDVVVAGGGVFGVAAALSLARRGLRVTLLDPGPVPHPLAASTDVSKVVRMEYGADEAYMALVERALDGWHAWNDAWRDAGADPLYHETGVLMVTRTPMAPGGFEHDSFATLRRRGHRPERLDAAAIAERFPAWRPGAYVDGFFHARGGWAESGRVVERLVEEARAAGVTVEAERTVTSFEKAGGRVVGVRTADGGRLAAGVVVVAAGAWTPALVPELAPSMKATGHPVFHLRPDDPDRFAPPGFPVFTADVARTGWYGFPFHPGAGIVKLGNHGPGVVLDPARDPRVVTAEDEAALRRFLAGAFPGLADAPVVATRRCLYTDTLDGHFWIDRHPERSGLVVASGGSGHGFKFAPVLGDLVADAVLDRRNEWSDKFRWRDLAPETRGEEAARHRGELGLTPPSTTPADRR